MDILDAVNELLHGKGVTMLGRDMLDSEAIPIWIQAMEDLDIGLSPDITIAVRMTPGESAALDYYILPTVDMNAPHLRLAESNQSSLEIYRFDTLNILAELSRRTVYRRAA